MHLRCGLQRREPTRLVYAYADAFVNGLGRLQGRGSGRIDPDGTPRRRVFPHPSPVKLRRSRLSADDAARTSARQASRTIDFSPSSDNSADGFLQPQP